MSKVIEGRTIDGEPALTGLTWRQLQEHCSQLERFSIEVTNTKHKTQKQLGAYFGLVFAVIIAEFNRLGWDAAHLYGLPESTGVGVTVDMLQQYFYALLPVFKEDGTRKTMRDYTTTEMKTRYEQIEAWAAAQWQIYIPPPCKDYWLKKDKNDVDKP